MNEHLPHNPVKVWILLRRQANLCGVVDREADLTQHEGWLPIFFVGCVAKSSGGDGKREGRDPDGVALNDVF